MTIQVVSPSEAEKADYVVCCRLGSPTIFSDNAYGQCTHCGHASFFRPYMPKGPPKICVECMLDMQTGGRA